MFFKTAVIALALMGSSRAVPAVERESPGTNFVPHIVGGEEVLGREFPAQISLRVFDKHNCGGSILNQEWILTAAHCSQYDAKYLTVYSGSNLLSGGTKHQVTEIHYNDDFDYEHGFANDVGVMKVSPSFVFGNGVEPIKLPQRGLETPAGANATIVGWGRVYAGGPGPDNLLKADINIFDHEKCTAMYDSPADMHVYDSQICAGGDGVKDACNGDSGGPLLVNNEIVGIVSWGRPCAVKGYPTVFTKVSDFIDWIENHINSQNTEEIGRNAVIHLITIHNHLHLMQPEEGVITVHFWTLYIGRSDSQMHTTGPSDNINMFFKTALIVLAFTGFSQAAPKSASRRGWRGAAADPSLPGDPYIVGGEIVQGRQYPAQISIWDQGQLECGGSILNEEWILTAGNCSQFEPSDLTVFSGSNILKNAGTKHQVVEIHYHEGFNPHDAWKNDIGVMKVTPPFVFGNGIEPINLPDKDVDTPGGTMATVVGWGRTSVWGPISNELRKADVPIDDQKKCTDIWASEGMRIHDTQICAAGTGGKDACNGDSGGPLLVDNKIVGIVSWGRPCAQEGWPTVFTRVSKFVDWIQEHIKS
ncbi:transmembrane protease serine 9-like [Ischnura elegans]|uniref:transmembrane protease serine 9-like n=1 Tax=Ischnura elegans TaxID=197161 RepID=UPI001ED8A631|nr:transmembrane protease serine 9-like [Ischnura elegans]